jgi:uncharacterized protein (DUF1684 family)
MGRRGGRGWSAVLLALLVSFGACSNKPPAEENIVDRDAAIRAQKDREFAAAPDGQPIAINRRAEFLPLAYFPIDPDYSVPAILRPSPEQQTMKMPTSVGAQREMRRVGRLEFTLKGQPLHLTAFVEVGAPNVDHLFVPFTDMTGGTETYPGGRYLDLDRNATGVYEIDFNRAYQPYCYYNPTFDCPYPPPENRLAMPIRAGERIKKVQNKH